MKPKIVKEDLQKEYLTPEGCFLFENWGFSTGDKAVSIARARVEPGVSTKAHHLEKTQEIYIIVKGKGEVQVEGLEPTEVVEGDIVAVPSGASQCIRNIGKSDLIFYCVCTPSFKEECYRSENLSGK